MIITNHDSLDAYFGVANYLGALADEARAAGDQARAEALDEATAFHAAVYAGFSRTAYGAFGPRADD